MKIREFARRLCWPLVTAQMSLIAAIISAGRAPSKVIPFSFESLALLLLASGAVLGVWAIIAMRIGNFSVLPTPVADGALCQRGPYSKIRHPMYTSVILFCSGFCVSTHTWFCWLAMLALVAVLIVKLHVEEFMLADKYTSYQEYSQRTHRLLPAVY